MKTIILPTLMVLAALLVSGCLQPTVSSVTVNDQQVKDGTVTIDDVVVSSGPGWPAGSGWLVIHADSDGSPGEVIGYSSIQHGENSNVIVSVDTNKATETLYAMLHTDFGEPGVYEFPGEDLPMRSNGEAISQPFRITMPNAVPNAGLGLLESSGNRPPTKLPPPPSFPTI